MDEHTPGTLEVVRLSHGEVYVRSDAVPGYFIRILKVRGDQDRSGGGRRATGRRMERLQRTRCRMKQHEQFSQYDAETFRETMETLTVELAETRKLLAGSLEWVDPADMNEREREWWDEHGQRFTVEE